MAGLFTGRVTKARRLSPSFMRLTVCFSDPTLFDEEFVHFRLFLRAPSASGEWPARALSDGMTTSRGKDAFHARIYTLSRFDRATGELEFDVFLHGRGHACAWALNAAGHKISLSPLKDNWKLKDVSDLYMFGDETALPAIRQICRRLPPSVKVCQIVLTVGCSADVTGFPHSTGLELTVLERKEASITLLGALERTPLDKKPRPFIWYAGERSSAVAARRYLLSSGFADRDFLCAAYWVDDQKTKPPQRPAGRTGSAEMRIS